MAAPPLRIVVVYPDLLGTYGDRGNGIVLASRACRRGLEAELVEVTSDRALPLGDVYVLGGGEDAPQVQAAELLAKDGMLVDAVSAGAVVLAVCAGYQLLGTSFPGANGAPVAGLGVLSVATAKGPGRRAVGEAVVEAAIPGVGLLSGFENHAGISSRQAGTRPLGEIRHGVGNGDGTDGAWSGRVVGTYLHGPVLARNPGLADVLLAWATGREVGTLSALDDRSEEALRAERLGSVLGRSRGRAWRRRRAGIQPAGSTRPADPSGG